MKKLIYFSILITLVFGCDRGSSRDSDSKEVKSIEIDSFKKNIGVGINLFLNYDIIRLETSKDFLISRIDKVEIIDDKIIVYDGAEELIKVFSDSGKGLCQIGKKGRGPGEYDKLKYFYLDRKNKLICIANPLRSEVIEFTLEGELVNTVHFDSYTWYVFAKDKSGNYIFHNQNQLEKDISIFSKGGKLKAQLLKSRPFLFDYIYTNYRSPLSCIDSTTYFVRWLDKRIYSIKDDSVNVSYELTFNGENYPKSSADISQEKDDPALEFEGLPSSMDDLIISKNFIFLHLVKNGSVYDFYYDKRIDKQYLISNYVSNGSARVPPGVVVGCDRVNDRFIYYRDPVNFKNYVEILSSSKLDSISGSNAVKFKNELKKLVTLDDSVKAGDNPLLILATPVFK